MRLSSLPSVFPLTGCESHAGVDDSKEAQPSFFALSTPSTLRAASLWFEEDGPLSLLLEVGTQLQEGTSEGPGLIQYRSPLTATGTPASTGRSRWYRTQAGPRVPTLVDQSSYWILSGRFPSCQSNL